MSRASLAGSSLSRTSTNLTEHDIPSEYPDTDASHLVSSQYTLSEAIHARRADYTKEHEIRIKIGAWNVAGKKGTEHDVAAWFVHGKAVSEGLSGLGDTQEEQIGAEADESTPTEEIIDQEERHTKKKPTVPLNDPSRLPADEDVGLYVLGLQEMVDISSASEALRPYGDPSTANRWKEKLEEALPKGYQVVAEQQLIGLMLFIYASPTVMSHVSAVSTKTCGTGLMGYMGNKGAVVTRIVLGETTRLVFINSHLTSGLGKAEVERRNWDAQQIVNRVKFDPIVDSLGCVAANEEHIGDEDFCFWFGDLNYRLVGIPGEDVRRLLELHTRNEYDKSATRKSNGHVAKGSVSSIASSRLSSSDTQTAAESDVGSATPPTSPPSSKRSFDESSNTPRTSTEKQVNDLDPDQDPAHLQSTLNSLLTHDELSDQQKLRKAFHDGWREAQITFLPTYKYDVGSVGIFDSGEKKRAPSWCDRILYRTRKDKLDFDNVLLEEEEAKRRDADISRQGVDRAADDENNMLYDYDPDTDADDAFQDAQTNLTSDPAQVVRTKEGYDDIIQLEYYISHQRVLSSDHKPLDAIFKLQYDAADSELKSKVHAEVARDLDRVENEGRPVVTVVPDASPDDDKADMQSINFGAIRYQDERSRSLTVANTGRAPAFFGFLNRPGEDKKTGSPTPPWMDMEVEVETEQDPGGAKKVVKSKTGFEWAQDIKNVYSLEPGDACIVKLMVQVHDRELVRGFNNGGQLDDVLILRIRDGRDHFMPIRGSWCQTCFCRSISDLVKIPEGGIRRVQEERSPQSRKRDSLQDSSVKWSAPRELFLLTETIENMVERIVAEWSMLGSDMTAQQPSPWENFAGWPFVEEGWTTDREARIALRLAINEALDNGKPLDKVLDPDVPQLHRLEAFAETLLLFLESLTDGVIPAILWKELEQKFFTKERAKAKRSAEEQRASVLEILSFSSHHSVSFVLLTSMLSRIVHEVATHCHEETSLSRSNTALPTSPKLPMPMKLLDPDVNVARKQLIRKNLAVVFGRIMMRSPEPSSAKGRYAQAEQKQELIEVFLDNDER